jgi:hypothetical protein
MGNRRWAFGVLFVVLSVLSSPRPSPLYASRTHAAPRRAGASGIVVTYSPGPLATSTPRYMGKPTIHGEAQTFDPNLEPGDGDDEALDDVRVVRVRSIRVKTSAHGAPHVVDAKEAVDPAPLLEALADKHLTSFTTPPRTTSRFCALPSATSTAGPSPTHDAGGPGLYYGGTSKTANNLQDLLQRLLEVTYLRFATSEEGYAVSLALTELWYEGTRK